MVVMVENDWDKTLMWSYFSKTIGKLKSITTLQDEKEISYFKLKDGYIFAYNGIYAFANKESRIYELFVLRTNCLKIQYINTLEISRNNKQLVIKIREFFDVLNEVIMKAIAKPTTTITARQEDNITLDMFKSQLLKENEI